MVRTRTKVFFKTLYVVKVAEVKVDTAGRIQLKRLEDLEGLLIAAGRDIYFETDDCYFAIIDDIYYYVPKRKRRKKEERNTPGVV